jgi:AcrR family transcriptional regulator
MAPRIVNKDEKRMQIALAAIDVFGENGFERTRMEDVAVKAGVGKGTIYEYFKNKEELMEGALQAMLVDMHGALMPEPEPGRSSAETLKVMSMTIVEAMSGMGGAYRFFLEYMLLKSRRGDDYGGLRELLLGFRKWLAELIEKGKTAGEFRKDVDSYEAAAAFAAWFDGAIFHWIVLPEDVSIGKMVGRYLEIALDGLMTKGRKKGS